MVIAPTLFQKVIVEPKVPESLAHEVLAANQRISTNAPEHHSKKILSFMYLVYKRQSDYIRTIAMKRQQQARIPLMLGQHCLTLWLQQHLEGFDNHHSLLVHLLKFPTERINWTIRDCKSVKYIIVFIRTSSPKSQQCTQTSM